MAATLVLDIVTNASKAITGLKNLDNATDKSAKGAEKAKSGLGGMAKAAGAAAGAAALGGLVVMMKTGVDEQTDFLAGQAQLTAGIRSTHNAANVTVGGLEKLAGSIQNYSGQTDDSIVASEKMLLTFTNVHNAAGKNNDIFNQATKMTADMAARMGGPASKYAVQLGKALNDPVKGLTALTRIGVSFTAGQKDQIKSMVASGNTMGAQKIIMGELQKEFGGSARAAGQTLPGQMARAKRSFEDVSQSLVSTLMPVLALGAKALGGILKFMSPGLVLAFAAAIGVLAAAFKVWQFWTVVLTAAQRALALSLLTNPIFLIVAAVIALGVALVICYKKFKPFRDVVNAVFRAVAAAAKVMWGVIKNVFHALMPLIKLVGAVIRTYIGIYIAAFKLFYTVVKFEITAIIAVIKGIWTVLQTVGGWFATAVSAIGKALSGVTAVITAPFRAAWQWISGSLIPWIKGAWNGIAGAVGRALSGVTNAIIAPFRAAWQWIANSVIPWIKGAWGSVAGAVGRGLAGVTNAIIAPFRAAWQWIAQSVIPWIKGAWGSVAGAVGRGLSAVTNAITAPFRAAWQWISGSLIPWIKNAWSTVAGAVGRGISAVTSAITRPFSAAWTWIKRNVIDRITGGFAAIGGALKSPINAVIRAWNNLSFGIPGFKLPFPPHTQFPGLTINTPNIPLLGAGAYVTRATLAVVGEGRGGEIVAPEAMIRSIVRSELANAGPTVVVNGALDPDAVARQIESILERRRRRVAGVTRIGAPALGAT